MFGACLGVLTMYYVWKTPTYRAEARILAQRQQALPSIGRQQTDDLPSRSASELIHRRENLIALIREADLVPPPGTAPAPTSFVERLKGALSNLGGDSGDADDPVDALVQRLDKALLVTTAEGTITISIDWPNPQQAYRLVDGALQNFLEARHLQEVTAIDEVISLLQGRAAALRDQLDRVIEETRRQAGRDAGVPGRTATLPAQPSEEVARLRSMLDAKDRAIADVEEFRRRRLADLQAQLDAQRAIYSDAHPSIVILGQDIAALSRESPQIAILRAEAEKIRRDYESRVAQEGRRSTPAAPVQGTAAPTEEGERVRSARFQYQQMVERVSAAQIDLDAARSAFKYRYHVVWPPEVPRKPVSPKAWKVFGLGVCRLIATRPPGGGRSRIAVGTDRGAVAGRTNPRPAHPRQGRPQVTGFAEMAPVR